MNPFFAFLKIISTEDEDDRVFNPVRVVWLIGAFIGAMLGAALFFVAVHSAWIGKPPGFTDMGTGFAAWLGGLGVYVLGGAGALWTESKAGGTVVEKTEVSAPSVETKTTKKTTTVKDK